MLERVVDEIYCELRRRRRRRVHTDELGRYYLSEGTDWCFEIAYTVAPELAGGLGRGDGRRGGVRAVCAQRARLRRRRQARATTE